MKKFLLVVLISACAGSAYGDTFHGSYFGISAGYSYTGAVLGPLPVGFSHPPADNLKTTKKGGAYQALFLGHSQTWGQTYLAGELVFSYDASHPEIFSGSDGMGGTIRLSYRPRMGVGFAGIIGRFLMPQMIGFMRLGIDCNSSVSVDSVDSLSWNSGTSSKSILNFIPGIGLKGVLNDQFSWIFGIDYKFCFSSQVMHSYSWKHRPTSIIGKVGISYHF